MAALLAAVIVILLNAGIIPQPQNEDEPFVAFMGQVAIDALVQTTDCVVEGDPVWDYNVDNSQGLQIIGRTGTCEYAGEFYRSPETGVWFFEVSGS